MSPAAIRQQRYKLAHPDRVVEANKKWDTANRVKKNFYNQQWWKSNSEKAAIYRKKYREANIAKEAARQKAWRAANIEKVRAYCNARRALRLSVDAGDVDINRLLAEWNGLCGICRKKVIGSYHVDHIIPLSKGGPHAQINLQLTHPRCNLSKGNKEKYRAN